MINREVIPLEHMTTRGTSSSVAVKVVFFTNSFCHFSGKQKRELTSGSFCEDIDGIQIKFGLRPKIWWERGSCVQYADQL